MQHNVRPKATKKPSSKHAMYLQTMQQIEQNKERVNRRYLTELLDPYREQPPNKRSTISPVYEGNVRKGITMSVVLPHVNG